MQIPTSIAWDLGHNVAPSIAALTGDDVSSAEVNAMVVHARQRAAEIVRRCDIALNALRSVNGRYAPMLLQDVMLDVLLQDALDLIGPPIESTHRATDSVRRSR